MIPMGLSFLFLGVGFGLYATSQGFPWWTAPVLASTIFAGSMEFVTIGLLMAGFDPVNTFMLTLFVNGASFLLWSICTTAICAYGMEVVSYSCVDV